MKGVARRRLAIAAALCLAAILVSPSASGQTPGAELPASRPAAPVVYRRVFVPVEGLENQIRGLLPLAREEFERRLALAQARADQSAGFSPVRVEEAVFRARLDGDVLRDGVAEIVVSMAAGQPSLLALAPCNVALESAAWQGAQRRAAVIGADPAGIVQCLVESSGTLQLEWSQAALSGVDGATFDLRLPAALRRRLAIVAPKNIELSVAGGLIVGSEVSQSDLEQRHWEIQLGARAQTRLTAREAGAKHPAQSLVVVREHTRYSVLRSALDMETSLKLSVPAEPLQELLLEADSALEVTAVHVGEQSLPFRAVGSAVEGQLAIRVPLAPGAVSAEQAIEISATTEWPAPGRWKLPRIRVVGGLLQEGQAEVHAPAWLRLSARPVKGCAQIEASPATAGRANDRFSFQMFDPEAAIEISANDNAALLQEISATQITVESNQVQAVLAAELTSLEGSQFTVIAQAPRNWIIDAVETQPPELLADRTVTTRGSGPQILQMALAQPLTRERPLSLIIRAHYRRPANNRPLGDEFFHVATFPDAPSGRRLVAVRVNDPGAELRLTGDRHLKRIDPAKLTPTEARLLETPVGSLLFERGSESDGLRATLAPATARYRTEVLVRAEVEPGGALTQAVSIRCQPEASAVGSVVARLAPRPRGDVTWRLAGDDQREVAAVLEGQGTGATADEAVYRLLLPRPQTTAFEVVGSWSAPISAGGEVSFAALPDATRQTGFVEVHAPDGEVTLRTSQVQPLPHPPQTDQSFATLRGRYQYEAGRRNKVLIEPAASGQVFPAAFIESLELTSQFSTDGSGQHEATFWVVNAGEPSFRIRLPTDVHDCHLVTEDGVESPLDSSGDGNSIVVPLPAGQRRASVRVRYSAQQSTPSAWPMGKLAAPVPQPDLTVLGQRWRVWLAPGLAAMTPSGVQRPKAEAALATASDGAPLPLKDQFELLGGALEGPAVATKLPFWGSAGEPLRESANVGWNALELELPRQAKATLIVYLPTVLSAWSVGLGLIAAAVAFWLTLPTRWIVLQAGLLLAAAAASNAPLAWLLGAASLGTMAGSALLAFRANPRDREGSLPLRAERTTALLPSGATSSSVTMILLGLAGGLFAAPEEVRQNGTAATPRVVFPVDEQQQPVGNYVYLDGGLYDRLHTDLAAGSRLRPLWLLEKARYELPAVSPQPDTGTAAGEFVAVFEFHTFADGTTVDLPLSRDQLLLLAGRARLDGQPAKLSWREDGQALSLSGLAAGKHRLELILGAMSRRPGIVAGSELSVPTAAMTSVALAAGDALENRIPPGAVTTVAAGAREFRLPPTSNLNVVFPTAAAALATAVPAEAEQLLWWRIRPGSVMLEGRFRLRPVGGTVREATLVVDPRLRLLPGQSAGPIGRLRSDGGAPNHFKIELSEPTATEVELRLAWLWPDASGVGQLLLPRVELRSDRMVRNWTALSLEAGLEIERLTAAESPSLAEFSAAWNGAQEIPSAIVSSVAGDLRSMVIVRPVASLPQANLSVDWSISGSLAQATCTIGLSRVPATHYEHRLALPTQMKPTRVELMQAGRVVATRWMRQPDGLLILSLLETPAANQTLTISANMALTKGRPQIRLPSIGLQTARLTHSELRIYRQPDVSLEVQPGGGWSRKGLEASEQRQSVGRLVVMLASDSERPAPVSVSRKANQPQVTGQMVIRADQADGDWQGEAYLNLDVVGGVLDEIRLAVPEEWSENLLIEPAMEQRVDATLGEPRLQLTLRPREALSGKVQVRIRGPLQSSAGGVQAPDAALIGNSEMERLVLLDKGAAGEQIDWETTGLLAAGARGTALVPEAWRDAGGDLFRVVAARFDATARIRQARASQPRIRLADLTVTPLPGRRVMLNAAMTVQPMGTSEIHFSLPAGRRLIQALVDGVAAHCATTGVRSWRLAAPSDVLPYRLTIVYDTFLPANQTDESALALAGPQFAGMEIQRMLWTVNRGAQESDAVVVPSAAMASAGGSARECSAADGALIRLQALAQALDDIAAAQGTAVPPGVLAECFVRWQSELEAVHRRYLQLAQGEPETSEARDVARAALESAAKVRQRLIQAGVIDEDAFATVSPEAVHETADRSALRYEMVGRGAEIEIVWPPGKPGWQISRGAIVCGIGGLTLLVWIALHFAAARDWLAAHSHLALAIAGIVWWLLAPLGWLGWPVVIAAVWLALWPHRHRAVHGGATLRRLSNSQWQ